MLYARRPLCVSIHDVAPSTWRLCHRLREAIAEVAAIPVTLLVVPNYHRLPVEPSEMRHFQRFLERCLANGDELALHGYTHLDEGPAPRSLREYFWRRVFTLSEGEFSALTKEQAERGMLLGLEWFAQHGWPVAGFVAPAWLMSQGSWDSLQQFGFRYTTSLRNFYRLNQTPSLLKPVVKPVVKPAVTQLLKPVLTTVLTPELKPLATSCLFYSTRYRAGRWLACRRNWLLVRLQQDKPLVRLGLHPKDAHYPQLVRDSQALLSRLLFDHQAMQKARFAVLSD